MFVFGLGLNRFGVIWLFGSGPNSVRQWLKPNNQARGVWLWAEALLFSPGGLGKFNRGVNELKKVQFRSYLIVPNS